MGHNPPKPRNKRRSLIALLALTTAIPSVQGQNCLLPETFNPYFQAALDDIDSTLSTHVVGGLNDIGLGPIAELSANDLVNFKENIFEPLFGNNIERNEWINITAAVDVAAQLESRLDNVIGSIPPELSITCELETTDDLEDGETPYRFAMELVLAGSFQGTDLDLTSLSPKIAVLPEDLFDPLALTMEALSADYDLRLPLTIDTKRRKFMIGDIYIMLEAALKMNVWQSIPLTDTVSQTFQGSLALDVSLLYSSVSDWTYTASFDTSLTAETSDGTVVANLGLIAADDDLFDDKPREYSYTQSCLCRSFEPPFDSNTRAYFSEHTATVVFDFDACDYADLVKTSIMALTFTDELNSIVESYLDPVLDSATIFPEEFTDNIKSTIVSAAEAKVNEAKAAVITEIGALIGECQRRRLGEIEIGLDGSQRRLQGGLTFGGLAASIQVIDGVVSYRHTLCTH